MLRLIRSVACISWVLLSGCSLIQLSQPDSSKLLNKRGFNWGIDSTTYFTIYYEHASSAQHNLTRIKEDVKQSFDHNLNLLGETDYPDHLHVFIVESRDKMAN